MKISRAIKILVISGIIGLLGLLSILSFTSSDLANEKPQLILDILMSGLENTHYAPKTINDTFSEKCFNLYIKRLDYSKKFLLQSDVDKMSKYKNDIDNEIKGLTFELFDLSNTLMNQRVAEKEAWYKELLAKPFNYEINEVYETDGEKQNFCTTDSALKDEWRKTLKYQTLSQLNELMDAQENIKDKKKSPKNINDTTNAAIQNDSNAVILPFDSLELHARKKVLKIYTAFFKRIEKISRKDRYANYLNAITAMYDPHTEFFPPKEKKRFDQLMSGQLEGIGARLQQKDDHLKVIEIIFGSPSWKQGDLKVGDIILKVAQGSNEPVDITGMEIEDAIDLIKGKKGTEVRLTVRKNNGAIKVIPIIRDVIQIDETFAHSAVINGEKKIGYIRLPSFYSDFTRKSGHRCSVDINTEIEKLQNAHVKGIILDLRDNGGGSLQEVIQMAGLFITKGPIVQVRKKGGVTDQLLDYDASQQYNGPLVIIINHNSASASEIMAAAMQDYKRAVIVGTQSFGKGTVQSFINLDNYLPAKYNSMKPLGQVKITMQKFYRINGGTTQLRGVTPDIAFPDPYGLIESGEKELDNPLPWDTMPKADYAPFNNIHYSKLIESSENRIKHNEEFTLMKEEEKEIKIKREDTKHSLVLEKFRAERKEYQEEDKKYDAFKKDIKGFNIDLLKTDLETMTADTSKLAREKNWVKNLKKDVYLHEAANIIDDMK